MRRLLNVLIACLLVAAIVVFIDAPSAGFQLLKHLVIGTADSRVRAPLYDLSKLKTEERNKTLKEIIIDCPEWLLMGQSLRDTAFSSYSEMLDSPGNHTVLAEFAEVWLGGAQEVPPGKEWPVHEMIKQGKGYLDQHIMARHVSLPSENVPTLHPGFQVHFRPIAGSSDYKVFPGDISVVHMTEGSNGRILFLDGILHIIPPFSPQLD